MWKYYFNNKYLQVSVIWCIDRTKQEEYIGLLYMFLICILY